MEKPKEVQRGCGKSPTLTSLKGCGKLGKLHLASCTREDFLAHVVRLNVAPSHPLQPQKLNVSLHGSTEWSHHQVFGVN